MLPGPSGGRILPGRVLVGRRDDDQLHLAGAEHAELLPRQPFNVSVVRAQALNLHDIVANDLALDSRRSS